MNKMHNKFDKVQIQGESYVFGSREGSNPLDL